MNNVNDATRPWQDPAVRLIAWEKIGQHGAALNSRLQSLATGLLAQDENLAWFATIHRELR